MFQLQWVFYVSSFILPVASGYKNFTSTFEEIRKRADFQQPLGPDDSNELLGDLTRGAPFSRVGQVRIVRIQLACLILTDRCKHNFGKRKWGKQ
jgi:hypothetical protein